jgi:two-component system sensor kinase FixL
LLCRRADKSEFLATVGLSPVADSHGIVRQNFLCFVAFGSPLEKVINSQNEFRNLYRRAPSFITKTEGPDHRVTYMNETCKRYFGFIAPEGQKLADFSPETPDQGFRAIRDRVYRTGEPFTGENIPVDVPDRSTGLMERRYVNFVYEAVRNEHGEITGVFGEGYEIDESQDVGSAIAHLQSELIHASRVNAMGTMAATIAHELNQPLSAIANYSAGLQRLLKTGTGDRGQLISTLQEIDQSSRRASGIIKNLRELTWRRDPVYLTFDLYTAVAECVRLVEASVNAGFSIVIDIVHDLMITGDRIQIQQVVINLLRNACEASSESDHPKVSIHARAIDQNVVVDVIDYGPGVTAKAAEDLFSWSDSAKEGGMGFGLSICRTIIEAHHGRIWLKNGGPGGTEFCFSIPTAPVPTQSEIEGERISDDNGPAL